MGLYFFGDSLSVFSTLPPEMDALKAPFKGFLLGLATFLVISKARDFVIISTGIAFFAVGLASAGGYYYEITKAQRLGRRVLAEYLDPSLSSGATIHNNSNNWLDSTLLVEFTPSQKITEIPGMRSIPYCNIQIPGVEDLMGKLTPAQLSKGRFFWSSSSEDKGKLYYKLVAALPDGDFWFYKSPSVDQSTAIVGENLENARVFVDEGGHVDRSCAGEPLKYHKKAFNSANVIVNEWDENANEEKSNEQFYDRYGKLLNGPVDAVFVYLVEKSEEFQKGFGKAGPLKCVGYYTYKQGRREGPYVLYYPGRIAKAFSGQYENGELVGQQKQYNPNGTLKRSWVANNKSEDEEK